ncbi:hypothetical protein QR680_002817 [Steinernema hermaphroditum]|uniref:Uncharacterized protein n=1 Tax=Steinernema hermaphroditum TaxID=289476 RepID=A0AA39H473_9BILA|nr:hypothetical protein QR680_002817 [Steinernema hermaphroditum]
MSQSFFALIFFPTDSSGMLTTFEALLFYSVLHVVAANFIIGNRSPCYGIGCGAQPQQQPCVGVACAPGFQNPCTGTNCIPSLQTPCVGVGCGIQPLQQPCTGIGCGAQPNCVGINCSPPRPVPCVNNNCPPFYNPSFRPPCTGNNCSPCIGIGCGAQPYQQYQPPCVGVACPTIAQDPCIGTNCAPNFQPPPCLFGGVGCPPPRVQFGPQCIPCAGRNFINAPSYVPCC